MRKRGTFGRRVVAAAVLGLALFAVSGGGAGASTASLPKIVDGKANAQTLAITLQTAQALPVLGNTVKQVISLTNGSVHRTAAMTGTATGRAVVGAGLLDLGSAASSCPGAKCGVTQAAKGLKVDLPVGLGVVQALGGDSITRSIIDTRNTTSLVNVRLTLVPLIGADGPLAGVGTALQEVTKQLNEKLVPQVNQVIKGVKGNLTDKILGSLPEPLQEVIQVGELQEIPDITKLDLLSLVVKESQANVRPVQIGGTTAMQAYSSSMVEDLSILGDWVSLDSLRLKAVATANGIAGGADSEAVSDIVKLNVGGLLGVKLTPKELEYLTSRLDEAVEKLGPVAQVLKILQETIGVKIETFGTSEYASPDGLKATASAGTLRITVEPKIPDLASVLSSGLDASKVRYSSAGVKLTVDLPSAESAIALGDVLDTPPFRRPPRTGLGTTGFGVAGLLMIGAAIMVRRFAL